MILNYNVEGLDEDTELDKDKLATILSRNWWVLLLRGLVAIAFGVVTWFQPGLSLASLVLLFGAYPAPLLAWARLAASRTF